VAHPHPRPAHQGARHHESFTTSNGIPRVRNRLSQEQPATEVGIIEVRAVEGLYDQGRSAVMPIDDTLAGNGANPGQASELGKQLFGHGRLERTGLHVRRTHDEVTSERRRQYLNHRSLEALSDYPQPADRAETKRERRDGQRRTAATLTKNSACKTAGRTKDA